jgi:hypothetical protein
VIEANDDTLLDESPNSMLAQIRESTEVGSISEWTDEKKKDFVNTFYKRSDAAKAILLMSATQLINAAKGKHFIGHKVQMALEEDVRTKYHFLSQSETWHHSTIGGRASSELEAIAEERVAGIVRDLPTTLQAVSILNKDTADKIIEKDKLMDKLNRLKSKLEDMPDEVSMAEMDQKMSIGDFRALVKKMAKDRTEVLVDMRDLAKRAAELDSAISKALYKGLPGLSEAVVSVVTQHLDRASALDAMSRRVSERVLFGDAAEAVDLLKTFENDEVNVSDTVREEFARALEKLSLKKPSKRLNKSRK